MGEADPMTSTLPRAVARVPHIRRRALKIIATGAVIAVAWIAIVLALDRNGFFLWGPGLGAPGVFLLIGLVELVSGRSFGELAQRWDELNGWQRGILGLVIVAIAVLVMAVVGTVIAVALV